jgi:hypothetical protein
MIPELMILGFLLIIASFSGNGSSSISFENKNKPKGPPPLKFKKFTKEKIK